LRQSVADSALSPGIVATENNNKHSDRVDYDETDSYFNDVGDDGALDPGPSEPQGGAGWGGQDPDNSIPFGTTPPQVVAEEGQLPIGTEPVEAGMDKRTPARRLQLLNQFRGQMVEQLKKLQKLYDRLHEKAESLQGE